MSSVTRELAALGFTAPGHHSGDVETLAATAEWYPKLDLSDYRAAPG